MTQTDQILTLARSQRLLRAADVRARGWSPQLLLKLQQAGKLQRVARGLYSLPDTEPSEHQALIEVCQRVPKAVICLLSALSWHEIGTQLPHEVWVALPEGTQTPALDYPPGYASHAYAAPPMARASSPSPITAPPFASTAWPKPSPTASSFATRSAST